MKQVLRLYQEGVNAGLRTFSPGERKMMLDVMNSTYVDIQSLGHGLWANIKDSMADMPGEYETKWGIGTDICDKVSQLPGWQAACLEIWANSYWYGKSGLVDIDEYIKGPGMEPVDAKLYAILTELSKSVELMQKSAGAFKSRTIADARKHAETAKTKLEEIL